MKAIPFKLVLLSVGLIALALGSNARAQITSASTTTYTWSGASGTDTNWSTTGNWASGNGAPVSSTASVVLFDATATSTTSTIDTTATLGALLFGGSSTTAIAGVPSFSVGGSGTVTLTGVTYSGYQFPVGVLNDTKATQTISTNLIFANTYDLVATASGSGALVMNGGMVSTGTKILFDAGTSSSIYLNGTISGTGGVRLNGGSGPAYSSIYLNGANTWTGLTSVQNVTLYVGTNSALGQAGAFGKATDNVTIGYGSMSGIGTSILMNGNYKVERSFGIASTANANNSATLGSVVTGAATFSGQIQVDGGTGYAAQAITVTATTGGTVYFTGANSSTGNIFYRSPSSLAGTYDSLTKAGGGTVVLGAKSNYQGYTAINGGTLSVGILANGSTTSSIGISSSASSNLQFNGGALQYTGAAVSTDRLFTVATNGGAIDSSGTGALKFTNTGAATQTGNVARTFALTGTNTNHNEMAVALTDNGSYALSLNKSGAGTWVLTGANTYTGATTVSEGKLLVTGSLTGSGAAAVTVANGALFGGSGTISGRDISVASGGTISAGDMTDAGVSQAGTLSLTGNLVLNSTSHLAFDLGSTSDLISITGNLTLDGVLDLTALSGFGAGTYHLLTYTGTLTDNTLDLGSTIAGYSYSITSGSGTVDLVVTAIPEPTSVALLGLSVLVLLANGRLHRRATDV